jgi:acyl-[acyl-carrier-protein]-phospholipid O-acyltransferase/long-chain-fatty-acid--[acyl-carrier-protein] ligase
VERTPPAGSRARPSLFFFMNVWRTLRAVRHDRFLLPAVVGAAYFSLIGAYLKFNLIPMGIDQLGLTDTESGYLFLAAALGIGCGALLTGKLSGRNIEFGIVPVGAHLCAMLPLFHSFGYTAGLWFPLLSGMAVSFTPSPLETAKVVETVRANRCTALFTTPTFLLAYYRRAAREDFQSLRHIVVGAEKLKPRVADAFEEKLGVRPREGYGATELSPVGALSLPDVEIAGIVQAGARAGSVGQPVPGVAVRIVDPDTFERKRPGEPGLMLIRGPNVMRGYLDDPDGTAAAMRDGWYVTGDIATVDEDGFITITDRLARFSKIGGEMIPHLAVEDAYQQGLDRAEPVLAVASVPDEKRGERLVVLYTDAAGSPADLQSIIERSSIPNLWKPAKDSYRRIESLPLTGSGKLDVKALRRMAAEFFRTAGGTK